MQLMMSKVEKKEYSFWEGIYNYIEVEKSQKYSFKIYSFQR